MYYNSRLYRSPRLLDQYRPRVLPRHFPRKHDPFKPTSHVTEHYHPRRPYIPISFGDSISFGDLLPVALVTYISPQGESGTPPGRVKGAATTSRFTHSKKRNLRTHPPSGNGGVRRVWRFSQGGSSLCQDCSPYHTVWSHHVTNCKSTAERRLYTRPSRLTGGYAETLKGACLSTSLCVRVY